MNKVNHDNAGYLLRDGFVGVVPTDTLYGLVASAKDAEAVSRVFSLKKRDINKPCIILINEPEQLNFFGVILNPEIIERSKEFWPGPVSLVFDVQDPPVYLSRGSNSLAFRMPSDQKIKRILDISGPLIAPSANTEGMRPASTVSEAFNYFGNNVDFYLDDGPREGLPSRVIALQREGENINLR